MTLYSIEQALAQGYLWARVGNRYWKLRRTGRTQTWKTRPTHFRIPVKAGLNKTGALTHESHIGIGNPQDAPDFVVATDPNHEEVRHE
jgi:hypothetical protein